MPSVSRLRHLIYYSRTAPVKWKKNMKKSENSLGFARRNYRLQVKTIKQELFSGYLDVWEAYLRDEMDTYCWTIIEEPRFVQSENLFVVHGISHDLKNGDVVFCNPSIHWNKVSAQKQLRALLDEKLKKVVWKKTMPAVKRENLSQEDVFLMTRRWFMTLHLMLVTVW